MTAVDTNVLVAAHRGEHRLHRPALDGLRRWAEGTIPWGVPVFSLAEFLRVSTHPRIFTPPSALEDALGFLDAILGSPSVRLLVPSPGFWPALRSASESADARGNLAFDAQIAAVCQERAVDRIWTADRDFHRFPHLEIELLRG